MLQHFLTTHRAELIDRCRQEAARRQFPANGKNVALEHGIPLFLDQTIETLMLEQAPRRMPDDGGAGQPERRATLGQLRETAARHGLELQRHGFSIEQVVHGYGDLCQAITGLALELEVPVQVSEFRTLNWCLDNAIADAVTEFHNQRELDATGTTTEEIQERLGAFAHEMRNFLHSAILAFDAVREGNGSLSGPQGTTLHKSMLGLRGLITRTLAEVQLTSGPPVHPQPFSLAEFIAEAAACAHLEASIRQCELSVSMVDPTLAVDGDRSLLLSALGNLLQNAFKFTAPNTKVSLNVHASARRIFIDVEDRCGGLSTDYPERMFLPFTQNRADRSGLGLGLSISRRSVRANGGVLGVRNLPGCGCVFTIDLPRHTLHDPPLEVACKAEDSGRAPDADRASQADDRSRPLSAAAYRCNESCMP